MRKKITPKLFVIAAILMTAFCTKAPENNRLFAGTTSGDIPQNKRPVEKKEAMVSPSTQTHVYNNYNGSALTGNSHSTNGRFAGKVGGNLPNVNVGENPPTLALTCPSNISVNATSGSGATVTYALPAVTGSCQQCTLPSSVPGFTYLGELNGHKYFRSNFNRNWPQAKDTANRLGAHLVTINSEAENNFLAGDQAWIGLTDEAVEGTFVWVTGEPVTFTNWWPGEPNNGNGSDEDYVAGNFYGTNKWIDQGTYYFFPFIIEFECSGTQTPTQTAGLPSGSTFPIGVTINSFSYTDACNNTATCSFTVTVTNNQSTTLTCPQNITVNANNGSGATVTYNAPVVNSTCQQCTLPTSLPGFTYLGEFGGHRYFRSNFERFWRVARDSAISLGGHLATVTSQAENNFLAGDESWIGLTDEAVEGTFVWVTGEPFVYSNWWPGNPNNTNNEDHVYMNFFGTDKWVDHDQFTFEKFIVEFECSSSQAVTQTAGLPSGSVFPVGTTTNSFSFTDGCANTATCSFTVTVLYNQTSVLTCPQNISLNATSGSGATVTYNAPAVTSTCQQCAGPTSLPGFTYLGDFGGHRYFRSNFIKNWPGARDTALGLGAHLATINSEAENNFLSGAEGWIGFNDLAVEGTFAWVTGEPVTYTNWFPGEPNNSGNEDYVLKNFYGTTKWVDLSSSYFYPFFIEFECTGPPAPTQTAGLPSGSTFPIGVTTNSFSFTDACSNTATCSFTVTVINTQPTGITCPQNVTTNATSGSGATVNYNLPVVIANCPQCAGPPTLPGFTYIGELNGHRYFRSDFSKPWVMARDSANRLGAHLVSITSEAENNLVSGNGNPAWIGLTDEVVEGTFAWVTGEPLVYTNWFTGNPNNGGGNEDHVYMNFFGTTKWVDDNASTILPFIIEFECSSSPAPTQTGGLPSGSTFPVGVTTNSFSYTDACANTVTCSFTVTVVNNQPTALNCPQNITVNATGASGMTVNYDPPTITSSCQQCTLPSSLPGYTYLGDFGGHKYFRSNSESFWQDAKNTAISLGGHLATVTSAAENSFLGGVESWIGLTDEAVEGTFVWVTGEPFVYSNWFEGNPNNTNNEDHVLINFFGTNKWADHDQLTFKPFIVEFECPPSPLPTQTAGLASGSLFPVGITTNSFTYTDACNVTVTCSFTVTVVGPQTTLITCPPNISVAATSSTGATVNYNPPVASTVCIPCSGAPVLPGFTYLGDFGGSRYFRSNFIRNWAAAKDTAMRLGAHLATINSMAENNFLNVGEGWIGLTDEAVEGTFAWVTGEPVTFTDWWPGEPNNSGNEDYVLKNFYGTTKWVDQGTNYFYPFFIEFECSGNPTPTQTAGLPSGSTFPNGVTTNTFSFTDACNTTVTCSFTVTVVSAAIACPQNISANATSGAGAVVTYNPPVVTDFCPQCAGPTSLPGFTYLGEYSGHRYFRSNFNKPWALAKDTAQRLGAHLATVTSAGENDFLFGPEAWIGLTDEAVEGTFVWVTGEPFVYSNWFEGNPNNTGGIEDHVFMNFFGTRQWVDHDGTEPKPFIIEFECSASPTPIQTTGLPSGAVFPIGVTTNSFYYTSVCNNTVTCSFTVTVVNNLPTTITCPQNIVVNTSNNSGVAVNYNLPVVVDNCPQCSGPASLPGFTYLGELNGHKYFRSNNLDKTWQQAKDWAIGLGAHLATLTSEAENNFLTGPEAWIGLTDEAVEGTFVWVTGEPFVYSNWFPGNPNNGGGIEDHVFTNFFGTNKWVDHDGTTFKPFIIEFECNPTPAQTAGLPSGSVFPIGVTTNSFSYTDACNNTVTCSFTVTVILNPPRYSLVGIEQPENQMQNTNTVPAKDLQVRAYPNPSAGDFNLQVFSSSDEPVTVKILDVTGVVKKVFNMNGNTKIVKAGADLTRGIYLAEVTQGNHKQVVKLVKLN